MVSTIAKPCDCPESLKAAEEQEQARLKQANTTNKTEQQHNLAERITQAFRQAQIPTRFQRRTFENFDISNKPRVIGDAFRTARAYSLPSTTGLIFFGPPGTGKTHLSAAIANKHLQQGHSVIFGTVPGLLSRLKETFGGSKETEAELMHLFQRCDLLILDDLGKEKVSDWVEERIYELINARYEWELPIIVTSNVGFESIEARYRWSGQAIVSRLTEMCRGIIMNGEDQRGLK